MLKKIKEYQSWSPRISLAWHSSMSFPVQCGFCHQRTDRTVAALLHKDDIKPMQQHCFKYDNIPFTEMRMGYKRCHTHKWKYITDPDNPRRSVAVIDNDKPSINERVSCLKMKKRQTLTKYTYHRSTLGCLVHLTQKTQASVQVVKMIPPSNVPCKKHLKMKKIITQKIYKEMIAT